MTVAGTKKQLKIGMIGLGGGASGILPAMEHMEEFDLFAGADVSPAARERFHTAFPNARVYDSAEEMCANPEIDAVWVASPNGFHAEQSILAARHGKHVVVEKPMAVTMEQAEAMVEAANDNGVLLLCGHTVSDPIPIRAMRKIIDSGKLGKIRAIQIFSYTGWLIRGRTPDELDINQGGGLIFRQGPRQVDTARVLANMKLRSVRGTTGQWMPERSIPGFYTAYMEFEDGTPCQILHNGHGYFMTGEFIPWTTERELSTIDSRVETRRMLRAGASESDINKQGARTGNIRREQTASQADQGWYPGDPGIVIVSCERGDMRHSQHGLFVYDDDGLHDVVLDRGKMAQRREELAELYDGIVEGKPVAHGGDWGMATLEVCLGVLQSGREHREIMLTHQNEVPKYSDDDIVVPYLES